MRDSDAATSVSTSRSVMSLHNTETHRHDFTMDFDPALRGLRQIPLSEGILESACKPLQKSTAILLRIRTQVVLSVEKINMLNF
ncbi:hypothetical protein GDO78_022303 [Eleutherodactylus coqui]|uniref:Uncharacterized protein n=1 Tax=Eleutherodactylus coqui TaxID=57060 RepID=A0A8J6EG80_ELECQ|nr:hypothetical protein GDO78_022303 [Eleutherodactylus coqui]